MIRNTLRIALAAASLLMAQAQAATVVTFTGVVTSNAGGDAAQPAIGETITGSYTIYAADGYNGGSSSDGSTYSVGYAYGQGSTGLQVSGGATFSGGSVVPLDASADKSAYQWIYRNYAGENYVGSYVQTQSSEYAYLYLWAVDYDGASSTLFTDPDGGLSFDQAVDISGAGISAGGYYETSLFSGYFSLTSLTISSIPEPANLVLMLAGIGLVGMRARRRQAVAA